MMMMIDDSSFPHFLPLHCSLVPYVFASTFCTVPYLYLNVHTSYVYYYTIREFSILCLIDLVPYGNIEHDV